jgi:hypothetical protein
VPIASQTKQKEKEKPGAEFLGPVAVNPLSLVGANVSNKAYNPEDVNRKLPRNLVLTKLGDIHTSEKSWLR